MPELVLYWIRLPAKQFLGTFLDIEVDQSGLHSEAPSSPDLGRGAGLQPSVRVEEATVLPQVRTLLRTLSKALTFQCSHGLLQAVPGCLTETGEGGGM